MAASREHVRAESARDMDALIGGMTPDCFNDVTGALEPFVGAARTAERYRKHWEGFPNFTSLCADETCVVTENEWRATHFGTFMGCPATGKPVRMRAIVVWHFKGDALRDETIFFDNASLKRQDRGIGSEWVTGTSIIAELWPDHARGRGAGLFQCGFGIGFSRGTRLAGGRCDRPKRLAGDVADWCTAGAADTMYPARYP